MMQLYDKFLASLVERYPHKPDLVNALMEVLVLEKESIYRRLRKDVYFSAVEMMQIAGAWGISIDNIVGGLSDKARFFQFRMLDYADPDEFDYTMLEKFNRVLDVVSRDPNGRIFKVLSSLPRVLFCQHETLERFFVMKWLYKCTKPDVVQPLRDVVISERMRALDTEMIKLEHSVPELHSIHDVRMIENLVGEIAYFRSIGLVTAEEGKTLRTELLTLLDHMEDVTTRGFFDDKGKKLFFYLSHTWVETECVLYQSADFRMSSVKILERNSLASLDAAVFERLMNMAESIKRSSVLISQSNTLQRAEFFSRQRAAVSTL